MPDVTTPSKEDKLQWIEDMGIDVYYYCPSDFGLKGFRNCLINNGKADCLGCFITALED